MTLYHICKTDALGFLQGQFDFINESLKQEGFIHCCTSDQISGVLERYFSDEDELALLHISLDKLHSEVRYEWVEAQKTKFPHVYGPINWEAVEKVELLKATDS